MREEENNEKHWTHKDQDYCAQSHELLDAYDVKLMKETKLLQSVLSKEYGIIPENQLSRIGLGRG